MPKATALDRESSSQAEQNHWKPSHLLWTFSKPEKQIKKKQRHPATSRALDVQISPKFQHKADEISAESQKEAGFVFQPASIFRGRTLLKFRGVILNPHN